jgi:hypothetical protein
VLNPGLLSNEQIEKMRELSAEEGFINRQLRMALVEIDALRATLIEMPNCYEEVARRVASQIQTKQSKGFLHHLSLALFGAKNA